MKGGRIDGCVSSALHVVSALAAESNICIGQVSTHEKSNEITAIPQLLSLIDIEGDIVSIDAMGCQTEIAKKIRKGKADYILAVKGNQGSLEESVKDTALLSKAESEDVDIDCGHGRIETSTGKTEKEKRYYISSIRGNAEDFNRWIRSHWAVGNKLHWVLDVTFKEDLSRKRKDNAAENFNMVLKFVITMLTNDDSFKGSYKKKRTKAAFNYKFRQKLLGV